MAPRTQRQWSIVDLNATDRPDGVVLAVLVHPKAKRQGILGTHDGCLKVSVSAPAEQNKANKALVALLAKRTGAKKSKVHVVSGQKSRRKLILIEGMTAKRLMQVLG